MKNSNSFKIKFNCGYITKTKRWKHIPHYAIVERINGQFICAQLLRDTEIRFMFITDYDLSPWYHDIFKKNVFKTIEPVEIIMNGN